MFCELLTFTSLVGLPYGFHIDMSFFLLNIILTIRHHHHESPGSLEETLQFLRYAVFLSTSRSLFIYLLHLCQRLWCCHHQVYLCRHSTLLGRHLPSLLRVLPSESIPVVLLSDCTFSARYHFLIRFQRRIFWYSSKIFNILCEGFGNRGSVPA